MTEFDMGRWLVRIVAGVSLLLSAAVVFLWVRSRSVTDHAYGTRGAMYVQATSSLGELRLFTVDEYPATVKATLVRRGAADEDDATGRWVAGDTRMYVVESERSTFGPVRVTGEKMWADLALNRPVVRSATTTTTTTTARFSNLAPAPPMMTPGTMNEHGLRAVTRPSAGALFDGGLSLAPPERRTVPGESAEPLGTFFSESPMTLNPIPKPRPPEPPRPPRMYTDGTVVFTPFGPGARAMRMFPAFWSRQVVVPYWLLLLVTAIPAAVTASLGARRSRVRRRRRAGGLCVACGYDLRGADGACPECGTLRISSTRSPS